MAHGCEPPRWRTRRSAEATQQGVQRPAGPEWGAHLSLGWTVAASGVIKTADWMGPRAGVRPQAAREKSFNLLYTAYVSNPKEVFLRKLGR